MKKSILLVITILMMTFGITTNVNADTCEFLSADTNAFFNKTATLTNGLNNLDISTSATWDFGRPNATSINNRVWYVISDTQQNVNISNLNLDISCSNYSYDTDDTITQTITYADGSTANIQGTIYKEICNKWKVEKTQGYISSMVINTAPLIESLAVYQYNENNQVVVCNVGYNGYFSCPYSKVTKYRFQFALGNSSSANIKYGIASGRWQICTSDTQLIINNQNQNTTTISNNITNLNDNILDSNLNSSTSSNASSIGSNDINSGSKNVILDFMLMPITFIQNLLNSFDNTCATLCIGNCGSGHDNDWRFIFPCIDLQSILGSTVYNLIDLLMTFGMVFAFVRSVVGFLKKALLLESDVSSEVRIF